MSPDEGYVLLTLGRCQIGDADGALEAIEHVDVEDFPFGRGARALARAIGGDHDGAIEDAEQVEQDARRQLLRSCPSLAWPASSPATGRATSGAAGAGSIR